MTDRVVFNRRDFLKLVGVGAAGTLTGCGGKQAERVIPYLVAPTDIVPGVPYWYASTCRECDVACGILVKAREGRAIKIEGNPAHPVNQGGMCARGHAALQGLYDPDRIKGPMAREGTQWKAIGWDEALKRAADALGTKATGKRLVLMTGNDTGSFEKLAGEWAAAFGGAHFVYEPFAWESVKEANKRTFGHAVVPTYDFARAAFAISFGADFLESFGSTIAQARGFAAMRGKPDVRFVSVEPRLSSTGSNADEWVAIRPGGEIALALGMARVILSEGLGSGGAGISDAVAPYTPQAVEQDAQVPADTVVRLAREFAKRKPSLAIAGGVSTQSEQGAALVAAVNLLNQVAGNVGETVRFDRPANLDQVKGFADVQELVTAMHGGQVRALVVHGANPAYAVPAWAGFAEAMDQVPFKLSLSSVMDETTARCDLVLPSAHSLESWGDAEPVAGVYSIQQPAMLKLPMFDTRAAGDTLIALAKHAGVGSFPAEWLAYLKTQWKGRIEGGDADAAWAKMLQKGGVWGENGGNGNGKASWTGTPAFASPKLKGGGPMALVLFPSNLHDGRGANKPWLQELPDPVTKISWTTWAEIHPETAERIGVKDGDLVKVTSDAGSITVPVYLYKGIRKDTIAMPLGQGHTEYGRYAKGRSANPLALLGAATDAASGALAYLSARVRVEKGPPVQEMGGISKLPMTQRHKSQDGRGIARVIPVAALLGASGEGAKASEEIHASGEHFEVNPYDSLALAQGRATAKGPEQRKPGRDTEPQARRPDQIPSHAVTAFVPEEQVRQPRQNPVTEGSYSNPNQRHRWAMAIDLNSCNGCQACVVACYAENNIATVGPELVKRGRDMAWLRIERYEERIGESGPNDIRLIPMLCQHCGDAPCEPVCPVYATYHNPEGLNAQIYNRCVGTRYCSNNCPYKVRSFNWFEYAEPTRPETLAFPEPLNWQLNPDVTVRSKGVMEKCTFCVQRILEGKGNARDENRPLKDGDIQTACAQSCPGEAIVFGDLMDPNSRVSKLSHDEKRRYWALGELNTKPGITYLRKYDRTEEKA